MLGSIESLSSERGAGVVTKHPGRPIKDYNLQLNLVQTVGSELIRVRALPYTARDRDLEAISGCTTARMAQPPRHPSSSQALAPVH